MRSYRDGEDYWRIRQFLRETYILNHFRQHNWDIVRWDYWRRHILQNILQLPLEKIVFVWEDSSGSIQAVLNPDSLGEAFFQIHPDADSLALQSEMLALAEKQLAKPTAHRGNSLRIWVDSQNTPLQNLLASRGYRKQDWAEHQRRRPLSAGIPDAPLPPGYQVRSLGDGLELMERCFASGLAFHPDDIKIALENRQDVSWYRNVQNCPLYRRDLDLVVVTPHGEVAAFCTVWFDDYTRSAVFEPVGTVPHRQKLGLGKAVMVEGLHRLQRLGALRAHVGSYSPGAHALYASVGFTEFDLSEPWVREWQQK